MAKTLYLIAENKIFKNEFSDNECNEIKILGVFTKKDKAIEKMIEIAKNLAYENNLDYLIDEGDFCGDIDEHLQIYELNKFWSVISLVLNEVDCVFCISGFCNSKYDCYPKLDRIGEMEFYDSYDSALESVGRIYDNLEEDERYNIEINIDDNYVIEYDDINLGLINTLYQLFDIRDYKVTN